MRRGEFPIAVAFERDWVSRAARCVGESARPNVCSGLTVSMLRGLRPDLRTLRLRLELVRLLFRTSPVLAAAMVGLVVALAVVPLVITVAMGSAVTAAGPAIAGGSGSPAADRLLSSLAVLGVVFVIGQALAPLVDPFSDLLGLRVRAEVFVQALSRIFGPASIAHLEDPAFRDITERAATPGTYGPRMAVRGLLNQWASRLGGVSGLVLVARWRWWAGVVLLVAIVVSIRRMRRVHDELAAIQFHQTQTLRRSDYLRELLVRPAAAKEIRVFGLDRWLLDRFRTEWHRAVLPRWARRRAVWLDAAVGMGPLLVAVSVFGTMAGREAIDGKIAVGEMLVVLQGSVIAIRAGAVAVWDTWVELGSRLVGARADLDTVIASEILRLPGMDEPGARPADEIRFEGVGFTYPGSGRAVFDELDLVVPAGQSLAIVGENGAGKTTLVKLLCRMYDPAHGRITVDGADLRTFDATRWQRRCAVVFQDFVHYPASARDNVVLASPVDDSLLDDIARRSGAADVLARLDHGWDTTLSREFGGTELSGGEWQRIALARAMYAAEVGASILVLDEPTAHLDARQEAAFYDRFLEVTQGRTSIIISHRFSTVRRADRIVVVEHGVVVEDGSHAELLDLDGRYAHLFRLQASRFTGTAS
jgi:ATP-binding cassette subfamily B protein